MKATVVLGKNRRVASFGAWRLAALGIKSWNFLLGRVEFSQGIRLPQRNFISNRFGVGDSSTFVRAIALLTSVMLVGAPAPLVFGQQEPKISVQSNIVTVFAIVHDKKGQVVPDLSKDDFAIDEDGRAETISYFARQNDLPLAVGLLVDTSLSQRKVLDDERTASGTFVNHTLREEKKDQAFLIHFDREVELLQDFTTSRSKMESALNELKTPDQEDESSSGGGGSGGGGGRGGGGGGGGGGYHHHGGGTLLYDAVYLAANDMMKPQQGRKAVIVLSDGVDRGSKETLLSAIEAAQRANTVVYSILFKGSEPYDSHGGGYGGGHGGMHGGGGGHRFPQEEQRPDGKKILEQISRETGGRMFEVSKKQTVDQIYDSIAQELRDQYILGYVPDKSPNGSGYRKIHVVVTKEKDLAVQARDGYYAD